METFPPQIASLFARHEELCGFSVRGSDEIPDSCPRIGGEGELFVGDLGVLPCVDAGQYAEIFQEVVAALVELLSEQPEAAESLRGRTFARVLH
jgi:hypothetical protein